MRRKLHLNFQKIIEQDGAYAVRDGRNSWNFKCHLHLEHKLLKDWWRLQHMV